MAQKRSILLEIWDDPHFQLYTVPEKLIFISFFTTKYVRQSGVYPLTFKTIKDKTGVPVADIKTAITETFKQKIVYDSQNSIIWVKNYLRHNHLGNPKVILRSVLNDFKATKRSNVWDDYWKFNGPVIEKLIRKSGSLQKALKESKICIPDEFINSYPSVTQYLTNSKLRVG